MLVEKCWSWVSSARPRVADTLVLLETASRDWVSPAPEAIANLSTGWPTNQNSSAAESADTMSEAVFGTIGGGAVGSSEPWQSPPTSNEEESRNSDTTATVEDTSPLTFLAPLRLLWNFLLISWLL